MNFLEKLSLGGQTTAIGLIVVFLVLVILIVIVKAIVAASGMVKKAAESKAARKAAKAAAKLEKKKAAEAAKTPAPATQAKDIEAQPQKTVAVKPSDDIELVAVLSAAVAAMLGTSPSKVRIASYKKTTTRSAWSRAGRREQIASRF